MPGWEQPSDSTSASLRCAYCGVGIWGFDDASLASSKTEHRASCSPTDPDSDSEWRKALLLANIELARDRGREALEDGEDPDVVFERTLDFIAGFVSGTIAMIVPPNMIDPAELDVAIARGRELAKTHGW